MQNTEQDKFVVEPILTDRALTRLFSVYDAQHQQACSSKQQQTSQALQPSRYDVKDIERDYLSECPAVRRRIRKSKRRKMVTNLSAKARRERKSKLYIEMLQNRIFQLQREIEVLRRANNNNKQTIKKNNDAEHIVNGFFLNKQRHYEKLISFTKLANVDEQKFMEEYGMLRMRQGAVGKDRMEAVNYYFKELSEIMIPDLQKYIIKTAWEESDLFDQNFVKNGALGSSVEQWRRDMIIDLQLSSQKIFHLSQLKEQILQQRGRMQIFFEELYDNKCKIVQVSRRIEMIYDRLNNIFSPRDIAKCLCLIEKYKFEKGFSIQDIFTGTFHRLGEEQKDLYDSGNLYESM